VQGLLSKKGCAHFIVFAHLGKCAWFHIKGRVHTFHSVVHLSKCTGITLKCTSNRVICVCVCIYMYMYMYLRSESLCGYGVGEPRCK
jgi:hypothetical protein